jgi:hypothetical protein
MIEKEQQFLKDLNDGLTSMFDTLSDIQDLLLAHAQWIKGELKKMEADLTEQDATDIL